MGSTPERANRFFGLPADVSPAAFCPLVVPAVVLGWLLESKRVGLTLVAGSLAGILGTSVLVSTAARLMLEPTTLGWILFLCKACFLLAGALALYILTRREFIARSTMRPTWLTTASVIGIAGLLLGLGASGSRLQASASSS